ncbi:hypothetical protein LA324_05350 [Corynebacterium coyleae]|uniref:phage terminase small subunit n=1 Tax=Corynebacterium coyleae TaxID=53374 RepID=UPI001CCE9E73|nr:hypothetical protein [Corynebacterium coyleae]UBI10036.1 hypothetical protein LA324_05350 [Corynebacterium coyleae]
MPKRSSERERRNKPDYEITTVDIDGDVLMPELGIENPHPIVADLWDSLGMSAQQQYYEPSDWQFARFTLHFANQLLWTSRPSAQMFQGVTSALSDLLVSEGSRRRLRMEIERNKASADVVDISELFRERMENA